MKKWKVVIVIGGILLFSLPAVLFADPSPTSQTDPKNPPCIYPCNSTLSQDTSPTFDLNIKLENPLKAQTIQEALALFMRLVFKIALPIIVFFFLWTGLSYIFALGNSEKLNKVHSMFLWTVVGTLLFFGAYVITNVIIGTVNTVINN